MYLRFHSSTALMALAGLLGTAHCGGSTTSTNGNPEVAPDGSVPVIQDGGAVNPDVGDPVTPDAAIREPQGGDACTHFSIVTNRRPQAVACPATPAPDAALPSYGGGNLDGGSPDLCITDGDCADGGVCSCKGATRAYAGASNGNACIPANCRVDSDCGPGGACSPTVNPNCGGFYGIQGYYCHTCADQCLSDADCTSDSGPDGYCAYDPSIGYWACGYGFCAG
jgi:hypothetical protein